MLTVSRDAGTVLHRAVRSDDTEGFHVVVAEDGSLPASELARLGLRSGEHLRLIPEQRPAGRPRLV
jgi:hypothetical protein